jgi:hypothetical protein
MFNAVAAGATGTANIVPTINVTSTTKERLPQRRCSVLNGLCK